MTSHIFLPQVHFGYKTCQFQILPPQKHTLEFRNASFQQDNASKDIYVFNMFMFLIFIISQNKYVHQDYPFGPPGQPYCISGPTSQESVCFCKCQQIPTFYYRSEQHFHQRVTGQSSFLSLQSCELHCVNFYTGWMHTIWFRI